jgi:hypothetical protein
VVLLRQRDNNAAEAFRDDPYLTRPVFAPRRGPEQLLPARAAAG